MTSGARAVTAHPAGDWPEGEAVGTVTLAFLDRHRRRLRLQTDAGESFLLDLARARHLAEGDGLALEGGGYIRVAAAAEPVLDIAAPDQATILRIAWHIGNRHLPLQILPDGLRIRADHVIAEMVSGLGGQILAQQAPFDPESGAYETPGGNAHALDPAPEHAHEEAHSHSHEHGAAHRHGHGDGHGHRHDHS